MCDVGLRESTIHLQFATVRESGAQRRLTMEIERRLVTSFVSCFAPLLVVIAVGCGDGGSHSSAGVTGGGIPATDVGESGTNNPVGGLPAPDPTAPDGTAGAGVALTLTPAGATVAKGTSQQYTAMAAYADG